MTETPNSKLIRRLSEGLINQIAAGEVIERPASVVKELVENALDAGADDISVSIKNAGKELIGVSDNGSGMAPDMLELALSRHATSKLPDDRLDHILTFGFRGEALPSIASISRFSMQSRPPEAAMGFQIHLEHGQSSEPSPCPCPFGTRIEVRDLFYNTPARRKFQKSDRSENERILDTIKSLSLAHPDCSFRLDNDGRTVFQALKDLGGLRARLNQVMGAEFARHAIDIDARRDDFSLKGAISLPTLNRRDRRYQFMFVNNRPVSDAIFSGSLRAAYADLLFHNRQPMAALYLAVPPELVDVNVHPAKSEVRFADPPLIRGLIIGALKHALAEHGHKSAVTLDYRARSSPQSPVGTSSSWYSSNRATNTSVDAPGLMEQARVYSKIAGEHTETGFAPEARQFTSVQPSEKLEGEHSAYPLGAALALVHDNYILAQTEKGLIMVDQHAAHERIVYEKLKAQLHNQNVSRQALLIPEVIELEEQECEQLLEQNDTLIRLGLVIEPFGERAVLLREVPAIMKNADWKSLMQGLVSDLKETGTALELKGEIDKVLSSMACHGSIRSGRRLNMAEMNALLRQMEQTENAGQCNHGRPTFISLDLEMIETWFERR